MKLSVYSFRNVHLAVLVVVWICTIAYNERVAPQQATQRCRWPAAGGHDLLVATDPQLIDQHTYPGRARPLLALSQHITNNYLYKNFRALVDHLEPQMVVFVGDYLDNGRLDYEGVAPGSSVANYGRELAKFQAIFAAKAVPIVTNVPGNHDIGWENGVSAQALERFHRDFGATNVVRRTQTHELVLLDTLSLSNTANASIYGPPRAAIDKLAAEPKSVPRILFTHVPLWKDDPAACGPLRESAKFPIAKGFQYQTVLSRELSAEILQKVQPDLVLSGDDHDYCDYTHVYGDGSQQVQVQEITVKSMSMAMGIRRPAVQLVTLSAGTHAAAVCYLPPPYNEVVIYCAVAFASVIVLCVFVAMRTSSIFMVMRKHNLYHQEQPVAYHRLTSYLQDAERDQEVNLSAARDLRGSYTFHTTTFTDHLNRKKNYRRFNYVLILKHAALLFAIVFPVYWVFVKDVALA